MFLALSCYSYYEILHVSAPSCDTVNCLNGECQMINSVPKCICTTGFINSILDDTICIGNISHPIQYILLLLLPLLLLPLLLLLLLLLLLIIIIIIIIITNPIIITMYVWMDGLMDGCMDGWMMDGCMYY